MSQSGCAMTAGRVRRRSRREEKGLMGWMDKSHSRLNKTREETRQLGLCGVVDRGVVDMSAVQNLSGVRGATTLCERSPSF